METGNGTVGVHYANCKVKEPPGDLVKMWIPTEQSRVGPGSLQFYPDDSTAGLWAIISVARHYTILPPFVIFDNFLNKE